MSEWHAFMWWLMAQTLIGSELGRRLGYTVGVALLFLLTLAALYFGREANLLRSEVAEVFVMWTFYGAILLPLLAVAAGYLFRDGSPILGALLLAFLIVLEFLGLARH